MTPSAALQLQIGTLLAGDTTTLASATALHVHTAKQPFTPSPALDVTTLVESDFGGYAPIDPATGVQLVYLDAVTGLITVEMKPPAGGWHFLTTSSSNLPQNVYGWYLTDSTDAILYGSGLLAPPVGLTASGQGFDLPSMTFAFPANSPI